MLRGHICDLTASAVQEAIGKLREGGASCATCNSYLRSIKAFSRWLYRDKRSRDDVLFALETLNEAIDRRRVRREFTVEELAWLWQITTDRTRPEQSLHRT